MSLDPNKTYLVWNGTAFPNSTTAKFKAPAGSTIDWGDGTVETFNTASTTVNTHIYTDGKTEHTIAISGLTSIDDYAFYNCSSLTSLTIGNGVTSIGFAAFNGCSNLTSITIPNSVTSIGNYSIRFCTSLTSITIPDSVTTIGENALDKDESLTQLILFPSTPPTLGSNAIPSNVQSIYVQQSSKAAYQAATNWTAFASKIVSDNIYLSFVRFNQKNKEYIGRKIDEKVNNKLTAPTTPTADSVVTMLANGTTGTKALSEFGGKLYNHRLYYMNASIGNAYIDIINSSDTAFTQPSEFISFIDNKVATVIGSNAIGTAVVRFFKDDIIWLRGCGVNPSDTTVSATIDMQLSTTHFVSDTVTEL